MSSSSERLPVSAGSTRITTLPRPDLREGTWTRLGPDALLGDEQAEDTLARVAEQARAAARAQGYSVGWAQGRKEAAEEARASAEAEERRRAEAEERRDAEHREAVRALTAAAARLQELTTDAVAAVEEQANTLAWELVHQLMAREVRVATGAAVVRRVLALAPEGPVAAVRLHPDAAADPALKELEDRGARIVADPGLDRADALVEVEDHVLDLRIGTAMERVRKVLG